MQKLQTIFISVPFLFPPATNRSPFSQYPYCLYMCLICTCVCLYVCKHVYVWRCICKMRVHVVHMQVGGGGWKVSFSITLQLTYWGGVSHLNPELCGFARLLTGSCLCLLMVGLQVTSCLLSVFMRTGDAKCCSQTLFSKCFSHREPSDHKEFSF